ncbi:MAG TPA: DNA-processing protein DprA [Thermoleophilaceae bacterium]|nr:DNA-processing protein DprA [Thermoleophilaceae bacterium]
MSVCEQCLRQSHLIAHLAPRIAGLLDRPRQRPSRLLELDEEQLIERVARGRSADVAKRFVEQFDPDEALERLVDADVSAICRHAAQFPQELHPLSDPPHVLYCTGQPERLAELLSQPAATVVGTRKPSPYGSEVARELGRGLAVAGVTVISGLALGVDALAHRGALAGKGRPVAVLACGPNVAYPTRHYKLHREVREVGVVLSELPPGCRPFRWSFPARNRIMAALGAITIVVEAADPSGSLITAVFANDMGKTVAAVPGHVTSRMAAGSNRLLREGAAVVRGTEDVLDELFGPGYGPNGPRGVDAEPGSELAPRLRAVLDAVEAGEGVGEIVARTRMTAPEVRSALGQLEAEGLIVAGGIGWYQRAASG